MRDGTHRRFPSLDLVKSRQHFRTFFLPDIDTNIRIQQESEAHYNPLRRCSGGSFLFFGNMSAGKLASSSKARFKVLLFSRSTISSPRRLISSSLLLTRNFFGNRTA